MSPTADPRLAYETRLAHHREDEARLTRRLKWIANLRLGVFGLGVILTVIAARGAAWLIPWLAVPVVAFIVLVAIHGRGAKAAARAAKGVSIYERGLANLDDRWSGLGESGEEFRDEKHLYAEDLDLFGEGSLFERVCTARTQQGRAVLASWLLKPATAGVVLERQACVAELGPRLDLREDLAVLAADVQSSVNPSKAIVWAGAPPVHFPVAARILAPILAAAGMASVVGWIFFATGFRPFAVVVLLDLAFAAWMAKPVGRAIEGVEAQAENLSVLAALLGRIEREKFEAPGLVQLSKGLDCEGESPSRRLARLARLVDLLAARRNQMFAPVGALVLWTTQLAFSLEKWRRHSGPSISIWLETIGEFEALCSLACFAFENPADPFPEIVESGAMVDGVGMGHPLLPASKCVRNSLSLGEGRKVLVISGSNMSGKSTFLRTVGTNVVLALAGGTVRAERLRLTPLKLGATLRVRDSLQEGHSRFYAELVRLKGIVDEARGPIPLLFLLDEILHGTNSHDRRLGAEAVVRGLVDLGAIGLVTTHDLALADVAERLGSKAENVHFADQFSEGLMSFDYTMRPGVVRHSNALALMRAVGLEVAEPTVG